MSDLRSVVSDSARSVLPVAGFEFSGFFLGKVAFDAVGLGVGPPCFQVDSEEILLKRTDERALLARAAPGATPGMKLVTKSWIVGRWENTNGMESMKYVPQKTASVWMPFEQACDEVSSDADFDSFKTVPWDAGGTQRDKTHEVMCRPRVHNVDRSTTGNTKCELSTKILVDTNCPRLEMTPGEEDASYRSTDWSAGRHTFRRTLSVSVMYCLPCAVASLPADKLYTPLQREDTVVCVEIDEWYSDRNERCVCPPAGIDAETRFGGTSCVLC